MWRETKDTVKEVLKRPGYSILALLTMFGLVYASVFLSIYHSVEALISSGAYSVWDITKFMVFSLKLLQTNMSVIGAFFVFVIAGLSGINIALLAYYLRKRARIMGSAGSSILGILSGLLGVGCASCGSVIITTLLGVTLGNNLITFLPLHGVEFSLVGVLLLLFAIRLTVKKIKNPVSCKLK